MKKTLTALALTTTCIVTSFNVAQAIDAREGDPAIPAMVETLSEKFERASGHPMDQARQDLATIDLSETMTNNIREGFCRSVLYEIHYQGHDLEVFADVCKINDELVLGPWGIIN